MKITNIDSFIEEFRNGRDIWSKASIELAVREIEKQRKRIAELEAELDAVASDLLWTSRGYDRPPKPPKEGE